MSQSPYQGPLQGQPAPQGHAARNTAGDAPVHQRAHVHPLALEPNPSPGEGQVPPLQSGQQTGLGGGSVASRALPGLPQPPQVQPTTTPYRSAGDDVSAIHFSRDEQAGVVVDPRKYASASGGDLYRSYEQFAGKTAVDPRMYVSPSQQPSSGSAGPQTRVNVAQQFVHSFGGFGPHGQPNGVGVGFRVEFNEAQEVIVTRITAGGSAARDGTLRVGDILTAIGQTPVSGKTLIQLRPYIIGPRGSLVTLTFRRPTTGQGAVPGAGKYSEYTIDLVRGDNLYFLQADNKSSSTKLDQLRRHNVEVEREMDNFRTILAQSQGRARMSSSELAAMQARYDQLQASIKNCKSEMAERQDEHAVLRETVEANESANPYKPQIRQFHEQLTRVEVQLGQVMMQLEAEHKESCKLVLQLDQEQRIAHAVGEKINEHEGFVSRKSQHHTDINDVIAQRQSELEDLRQQVVVGEAEFVAMQDLLGAGKTTPQDVEEKINQAQQERRDLEAQLLDLRNTLFETDAEYKNVLDKQNRLNEKHELVRALSDKRLQACSGLQQSIDLESQRHDTLLREAKAERRRARERAGSRQSDLRMQIDTIKDMNVQVKNETLTSTTELDTAKGRARFDLRMQEQKLELSGRKTRDMKMKFEHAANDIRDAQEEILQAKNTVEACAEDEQDYEAETMRLHITMSEVHSEFKHLFQTQKACEDFQHGLEQEYNAEMRKLQNAIDVAMHNTAELQAQKSTTQNELMRTRGKTEKLQQMRTEAEQHRQTLQKIRSEDVLETEQLVCNHFGVLREQLGAISAQNGETIFKVWQSSNGAMNTCLQTVDQIQQKYLAARSRTNDVRTPEEGQHRAFHHHQHVLLPQHQREPTFKGEPHLCVSSATKPSPSYTDQLMARSMTTGAPSSVESSLLSTLAPVPVPWVGGVGASGTSSSSTCLHDAQASVVGSESSAVAWRNDAMLVAAERAPPYDINVNKKAMLSSNARLPTMEQKAFVNYDIQYPENRPSNPQRGQVPQVINVVPVANALQNRAGLPAGLLGPTAFSESGMRGVEAVDVAVAHLAARPLSSANLRNALHTGSHLVGPGPGHDQDYSNVTSGVATGG